MKRVAVIGHFGERENLLNGQTIKTKIITSELQNQLGTNEVLRIDTHGGFIKHIILPFQIIYALSIAKNIIIFPAHNGVRIISPLLFGFNLVFRRRLHYVVIGGWLPELVKQKKYLKKVLRRFYGIYVETKSMESILLSQGFHNIFIMPNCKNLRILRRDEMPFHTDMPFKFCTFSRVMKEKGIEDACEVVRKINESYGKRVCILDIYGQIEPNQENWFLNIKKHFLDDITYCGIVPYDKSTEVLSDYYALLFPTYYDGEGFAGTIIDSFAAGVPVVASDWKYNNEIVNDGKTGILYRTRDNEELMQKIVNIINDVESWNSMKYNCIEQAKEYLPSKCIKILVDHIV